MRATLYTVAARNSGCPVLDERPSPWGHADAVQWASKLYAASIGTLSWCGGVLEGNVRAVFPSWRSRCVTGWTGTVNATKVSVVVGVKEHN